MGMKSRNPKQKSPLRGKALQQQASAQKKNELKKKGELKFRAGTKQEAVLGLLRRAEGATIDAVMKATGWQQHSVRGFFAGVVRKKLGLMLEIAKTDGHRIYRIVTGNSPKADTRSADRRAA